MTNKYLLIFIIVLYLNEVHCGMMKKMMGKSKEKGCPELDEMDSECAFANMCPSCPCPSPCGAAMPTMAPMMPMMPMPPMMPPMTALMGMMAARRAKAQMTHALTQAAARVIRRHMMVKRSADATTRAMVNKRSKRIERVTAFFIGKPTTLASPLKITSLVSVPMSKRSLRLKRQMPMLPNPMQIMMVAMMIMNMIYPGMGNIMYNAMAYGTAMARLKKTKKMKKKEAKSQWKEGKMRVMLRMMNGQLPVPQDFAENAYTTFEFPTMQGQMEVPSMIPGAGQMGVGDYLGVLQMLNGAKRRRR